MADPNNARTEYTPFAAYGRSKTANVLFADEFDRRHRGRGVRAAAVHPGAIHTELARYMTPDVLQGLMAQIESAQKAGIKGLEFKSIPQGAATSVWAATAPGDEVGGRYCEDCHIAGIADGAATADGVSAYAVDPENAKRLWAKSEEMVGERVPAP